MKHRLSVNYHQTWHVDAVYWHLDPNNIWYTCSHVAWRGMPYCGLKSIKKDQKSTFWPLRLCFSVNSYQTWYVAALCWHFDPKHIWRTNIHVAWHSVATHRKAVVPFVLLPTRSGNSDIALTDGWCWQTTMQAGRPISDLLRVSRLSWRLDNVCHISYVPCSISMSVYEYIHPSIDPFIVPSISICS
jgi:hypothetical protein